LSGLSATLFSLNKSAPAKRTGSLPFDFLTLGLARPVRKEMRKKSFLQARELNASSGMVWIASASGM
jgi:hypothetical protein